MNHRNIVVVALQDWTVALRKIHYSLSVCLSLCLSVCLSVCLSLSLSLSIYLSLSLSIPIKLDLDCMVCYHFYEKNNYSDLFHFFLQPKQENFQYSIWSVSLSSFVIFTRSVECEITKRWLNIHCLTISGSEITYWLGATFEFEHTFWLLKRMFYIALNLDALHPPWCYCHMTSTPLSFINPLSWDSKLSIRLTLQNSSQKSSRYFLAFVSQIL